MAELSCIYGADIQNQFRVFAALTKYDASLAYACLSGMHH